VETLAKISLAIKGIPKTEEHKANINLAVKGIRKEIPKTEKHKALISAANKGVNHSLFGRNHTESAKLAISIAKGTTIYVYCSDKSTLLYTFISAKKAGEFFNCCHKTILKYAKSGKLF
jgi:group I intron endonuclease